MRKTMEAKAARLAVLSKYIVIGVSKMKNMLQVPPSDSYFGQAQKWIKEHGMD